MNLKIVKKKFVLKYLKANKRSRNIEKEGNLYKINKVGILAEASLFHTYDLTKNLGTKFEIDRNLFDVILFQKSKGNETLPGYKYFSEGDFGMFGKIIGDDLKQFVTTEYDLIINYCAHEELFSEFICVKSKAKLIAGFQREKYDNYDISIKIGSNKIDTFNEELTKYLRILNVL